MLGASEQPVEELPTVYDDSEVEAVAVSRSLGSVGGDPVGPVDSVDDMDPNESYGHS